MTRAVATYFARVACVVIEKQIDVRLRNQELAMLNRMYVRKRLTCDLSLSLPWHISIAGSASKAEKVPNLTKPNFSKNARKFSKNIHL